MTTKGRKETPSESISEEVDPNPEDLESQELNSQTDGVDLEDPETPLEVVAAPGVPDFKNPMLAGKTPEEIERLFELSQKAVAEQNTELNAMHARLQQQSAPPPVAPEEEKDPYGDDFLADRFRTLESRLQGSLKKMVEPLTRETSKNHSQSLRETLRGKYKHFTTLEPHIDKLLRDQNIDPSEVTENQLYTIYHTAVGLASEQGINLETLNPSAKGTTTLITTEVPPVNIPQHRPSSAPLPTPPAGTQRKLTEAERRLAHEQFGQHKNPEAEYLRLQNMDEEDVVKPGFSKETW